MRYRFTGGPCDGRLSIDFTVKPPLGYLFDCGTHTYAFGADSLFHDRGLSAAFSQGATVDTLQVGRSWHKLMHALGVEGPAAIRRSSAARRRLRRAVR